jgi:NgoMIV restriction enzyme
VTNTSLSQLRSEFHAEICSKLLTISPKRVASNADASQKTSVAIALDIANALQAKTGKKLPGQTAGVAFETAVKNFIDKAFAKLEHLRPGEWSTSVVSSRSQLVIGRYEQYSHLNEVRKIARNNPDIAAFVGNDYSVASDVIVARQPLSDTVIASGGLTLDGKLAIGSPLRAQNNTLPLMHASISCKWTMRSDRAQNSRFEALNLIRSRKGRVPHIVVVTGEPTPSRLTSLALGTGDIDCVYHFALPELLAAVKSLNQDEVENMLNIMIDGHRLRDISDLPLDLAI